MSTKQSSPNSAEDQHTPGRETPAADQLDALARGLAERQPIARQPVRRPALLDRIPEQESLLRAAYRDFGARAGEQLAQSYAAEWLLDNYYIVQQALRLIREDMPEGYYRQLPKLATSALRGYPRVYALAGEIIGYCEGRIDLEQARRFLHAYQRAAPLTMGELWAVPTMLRLATVERLSQVIARVRDAASAGSAALTVASAAPQEPADDDAIANCIRGLRTLAAEDWNAFFEDVSRVEQILRADLVDVYARMDFATRDRYRAAVEQLALATNRDEEDVARAALQLAQAEDERAGSAPHVSQSAAPGRGGEPSPALQRRSQPVIRASHIGFYLLGAGRLQLESRLGYRPAWPVRLRRRLSGHPTLIYLGSIAALTLMVLFILARAVVGAGGTTLQIIGSILLALAPAATVASDLVNWATTHILPPRVLPKLDFRDGVPADCRTMVVVPVLLTTAAEIEAVLQQLELHFLGNVDSHVHFALLTDFPDAPHQHMPDDDALLEQIRAGIEALNQKHGTQAGGPFYLFHRKRAWNPREGRWMGWERKRGKLHEFNHLISGDTATRYIVQLGNLDVLPTITYVITLDADTTLPRDGARSLIATLAHPLNRAELDVANGSVIAGHALLQPRTAINPVSANRSLFTRIFSGDTRLDLYTRAVSDVYQDCFDAGSYVGKGIYDVSAFESSLAHRVPDNTLLSHDLFEGLYGHAALVTDVVLFEEFPATYLAYMRRLRRWVRGDWQLAPWLLPRVPHTAYGTIPNDLSVIDRWKILDNLRRSLLAPALLLLLAAGWLWLPGSPLVWTLAALLLSIVPCTTGMISRLGRSPRGTAAIGAPAVIWADMLRWLLALAFLAYEGLIMIMTIGSTLFRVTFTHRRLLQWTTFASTTRQLGQARQLALLWRQMSGAPLLALGLAIVIALYNPPALPAAAPFLLVWLLSPQIAYWIGRPATQARAPLPAEQLQRLRRLARRTWLYFETFVGPDDRWLPPDHFQEDPRGIVAHRTSPTNIGLSLLSTLAAHDLGYIGLLELSLRLHNTFASMDQLETYRGHFLNWYDTQYLQPLPARYVSTVDSGNLAGCLLALQHGCKALVQAPILRWPRWQGLLDTLDVLAEIVDALPGTHLKSQAAPLRACLADMRREVLAVRDTPERWMPLVNHLAIEGCHELDRQLLALIETTAASFEPAMLQSLHTWTDRLRHHLQNRQSELDHVLPWLALLSQPPALFMQSTLDSTIAEAWRALVDSLPVTLRLDQVAAACEAGQTWLIHLRDLLTDRAGAADQVQEAVAWCIRLEDALRESQGNAERLVAEYSDLHTHAEALFQATEFRFLFDSQRQVFHIGYNVDTATLDGNYYDLLASESRIASLLAIAKGDVPQSHWLHLGRPFTQIDGVPALLSWSGTMFEYLMPTLLMQDGEGTLLGQSCRAAVDEQIAYARQQGVPWGVSESGYYHFDANRTYQYQAFGAPRLGFKRGLTADLVVSPYASLLALSLRPQAVLRNVADLIELGALGGYGLYEAIDYTPTRLPPRQTHAIVRSYMVHHQGMILLALANYLDHAAMIRRFHADPRVQSAEMLLYEQLPQHVPLEHPPAEEVGAAHPPKPPVTAQPWHVPVDGPLPQAHALSNGHTSVVITSAGGGYSCWHDVELTRWRADTTLDEWGTWIYIQDRASGDLWSAGYQPTAAPPAHQEVRFSAHQAEFIRRDHDIFLDMAITVAPDDDVEIRQITLTNDSDSPRHLAITSYAEVVLAPHAVDQRHPAFSKLFVQSEYLADTNALLFRRRPRSAAEAPLYLAHALVVEPGRKLTGAHESDRACFLGRGRTCRAPSALSDHAGALAGTTGATLDPIMALGQEIELEPRAAAQIAYITLAATSRAQALALLKRYHAWPAIGHAFEAARAHAELELRQRALTTPDLERIQQLLSALLYPHAALRADPQTLAANKSGQPGLWPYAISGDYPILLVRVSQPEETGLVWELLRAHAYWRSHQIKIDLVVLNQRASGYAQELAGQLRRLITRADSDAWLNARGGIFLLHADQLSAADRVLLETAARAILDADSGPLAEQLERLHTRPTYLPPFIPTPPGHESPEPTPPLARPTNLCFDNGLGGFSPDGREYIIYLAPGQATPAPWINVVANAYIGFLVSETGFGCTWAENSGENRLTPWRNDPVADPPAEVLYLRDEETGQVWSPTPLPAGAPAPYLISHGAGYSIFEHQSYGLNQRLRLFAVPDAPLKFVQLRLENLWSHGRRITATFYAEWVLGTNHADMQQYIVPEFDAGSQALLARNTYNTDFGEQVAFVAASKPPHGLTADRAEFLGRMGSQGCPAALGRIGLAGTVDASRDPCAAIQLHIDLAPCQVEEICFVVGQGADRRAALELIEQYRDAAQVEATWQRVTACWDALLGVVAVRTPDPAMDLLLNRWLLYQALACRIWGRTALYQSSGAFGYRDQLQDVMALLHAAPDQAREHILRAARHQFEAGDVLHWWHPPSGRGIRSRCSDDLLWLPFVAAHYVATTGDESILAEQAPFLTGTPLKPDEEERYDRYERTVEVATLYEHCRRALEKGATAGSHGLPLIGSGDWNDGMSRVGIKGRGESVWLGWFLYATLTRFAPICERMHDPAQAARYRQQASALRAALETAWDGQWYRRAYDDDGVPLGSAQSSECQIDSIAQSWAVLAHAGDPERAARAMEAVADRLVRDDDQLLLLFAPPFDRTPRDPGYIKGYPPGMRENGGQYTHAALWAVWAFAELGWGDRAATLFRLLNPIYHGDTPEKISRYQVEPYVVAADVYSAPPHTGRGGWTWYTGSAAWMYRLGLEAILGLRRVGRSLRIDPCVPADWLSYELVYRDGAAVYQIRVENPDGVNRGVKRITLDGANVPSGEIPLLGDSRQHEVCVLMG
jgi:cyclic beta-1,2-glucan glucanotransferase